MPSPKYLREYRLYPFLLPMELCTMSSSSPLNFNSPNRVKPPPPLLRISTPPTLGFKRTRLIPLRKLVSNARLLSSPSNRGRLEASASPAAVPVASSAKDRLPADIAVTEAQEPNSLIRLSVEVPPAVCEDCYSRVLKEFMKQAKIPGFRPGKEVPESILLNYVGKQSVHKATVESILKRTLPHAMSSVSGKALKDSVRIVTKFSEMEKTYLSSNSLRYDVLVDVAPEVKWIPEDGYKSLKIVVEIDSDIDAVIACQQELKRRHKSLGALKIVTDRGLQIGDVAVLDISAVVADKDQSKAERIPSADTKGFQFDTEDGDRLIPGFLGLIMGVERGEMKSFPLVFPDTWNQENLRGVCAQFTVECKELFFRDLPDLNDSIADKLLPGCTSLKQVEDALLERCREVEQTAKEQAADNAILDQLCKMVEVDIPQSLFEEQGRQLYGAQLLQMQANTKLNEQQLASLSSPKAVNQFLESQKDSIINVIKQNLAVGDIFKRENLQVSTEEIVKEVENSISEFKQHKQEYNEESVKEQVQEVLEGAKVLEWLRERTEIQYICK